MYDNVFKLMDKKDKKKFGQMSEEERADFIEFAFRKAIEKPMTEAIGRAVIEGIIQAKEHIYMNYVIPIDNAATESERMEKVEVLLSYLRIEHLGHVVKGGEEY